MTLSEELKELLKKNDIFIDAKNNLLKNKIIEYALKLDKDLINLLIKIIKNNRIKQHFFINID